MYHFLTYYQVTTESEVFEVYAQNKSKAAEYVRSYTDEPILELVKIYLPIVTKLPSGVLITNRDGTEEIKLPTQPNKGNYYD